MPEKHDVTFCQTLPEGVAAAVSVIFVRCSGAWAVLRLETARAQAALLELGAARVAAFIAGDEGGELFFAEITDGAVFARLPRDEAEPILLERVQAWLNLQSAPNEVWDVYDVNRQLTGRTHLRGQPLAPGDFHLVVHVWVVNSRGEFLITQRSPNKGHALMWECTGGSAVAGDDSLTAATREVREETGLEVLPENGQCVMSLHRTGVDDNFCDLWLFQQDFCIDDVVLQPGETCGAMWASPDKIRAMVAAEEFINFHYIADLFAHAADPANLTDAQRAALYPIILREYDAAWPTWFAEEADNLRRLIGGDILNIRHIGSTAVPGLVAKPTVDILLEVTDTTDIDRLMTALPAPEYICLHPPTIPTPPPHLTILKGYTSTGFAERVFHIHVRHPGDWDEPLFCAWLTDHPDCAAQYAALKRQLAAQYTFDRDGYTTAKGEFIRNVMAMARG